MMQKRGQGWIVLGLFLITLSTLYGSHAPDHVDETPPPPEEPPTASEILEEATSVMEIYMQTGDPSGCNGGMFATRISIHTNQMDCHSDWEGWLESVGGGGCSLRTVQDCSDCSNDDGCAGMLPGVKLTAFNQEDLFRSNIAWGSIAENIFCKDPNSPDGFEYLCADDRLWKLCSPVEEGKVTWVRDVLYRCIMDEDLGNHVWQEQPGVDVDHDGHTTSLGDCDDNPTGDINCPETPDECGSLEHSRCAICINPSAPEICGDSIGDSSAGDPTAGKGNDCNPDTSNNCHENQAACEQIYLAATLGIDVSNVEFDPEGRAIVEGEELSRADFTEQKNIYNEQFSWTPTEDGDGGYCCGYSGITDLGETRTTPDGNNRICLNRNTDLVGREVTPADPLATCVNDWCWLTAADQNTAFHILTIKKPAEEAYDVISNNNDWIECQDVNANREISASGIINPNDVENANLFYCYKEGNHWSWAE